MVRARQGDRLVTRPDMLAVEEPLEIRLLAGGAAPGAAGGPGGDRAPGEASTLSVTMRTPGHDFELVAGLLLAEGIVSSREELHRVAYCLDRQLEPEQRYNVVTAELTGQPGRFGVERHIVTSSACGVCGTSSIEALRSLGHPELAPTPVLDLDQIARLPGVLAESQQGFAKTGGLHAAALVDATGERIVAREDVGRHNAVDKVLGRSFLDGRLPLYGAVLVVSGRVSFEIVQKALRAGVGFVVAVSAATSLAVRLASESGMTLVGFVRGDNCTVYADAGRIATGVGATGAPSEQLPGSL